MRKLLFAFWLLPALPGTVFSIAELKGVPAGSTILLDQIAVAAEDKDKSWDATEAEKQLRETGRHRPLNLGFTSSAWWLLIEFDWRGNPDEFWALDAGIPATDSVELHDLTRGGIMRNGDTAPYFQREVRSPDIVFPLRLSAGRNSFLLRYESTSTMRIRLRLRSFTDFHHIDASHRYFMGMHFGVLTVMILYNFFIFLFLREKSYLFYVISMLCTALAQLSLSGLGFSVLWPSLPEINYFMNAFFAVIAVTASLQFAYSFMNLNQLSRFWVKILRLFQITGFILASLTLWIPTQIANMLAASFSAGSILFLILVTAIRLRQRNRQAVFFAAAWTVLLLGALLFSLLLLNILGDHFLTKYSFYIGSSLEAVILSIGLGDRINRLRTDKREMEAQMSIARKIQESILPSGPPAPRGMEVGFLYNPMDAVGGDFLDFAIHEEKYFCCFICDVSGHGVPAALLASMVKVSLNHIWSEYYDNPAEMLSRMRLSLEGKMGDHFLTAFLCMIDTETGFMRYARAGHDEMPVVHEDGGLTRLSGRGRAICDSFPVNTENRTYQLLKGDRLILYTDGVTETLNHRKEMFGDEALYELLNRVKGSGTEICREIYIQVSQFAGNNGIQTDDFTIASVYYQGQSLP